LSRILVVEDDAATRRMLGVVLRKRGHKPALAASFEVGVRMLKQVASGRFSVALIDCTLSKKDARGVAQLDAEAGIDLAKMVLGTAKEHGVTIKIVAGSAYLEDDDRRARATQASHTLLTKPYKPAKLFEAIETPPTTQEDESSTTETSPTGDNPSQDEPQGAD
jgi:CheY-like chemotaxis protein